jgi:flagellar biosynthetic protein FliR
VSFELPLLPLVAAGLACVRMLALVLSAPFFGHAAIPLRMRLALAVLFTAALAPALPAHVPAELTPGALVLAALVEALVGACLGVTASLVLAALGVAAELISVQGGIGAAAVLDPTSGAASPALGLLAQSSALIVFLAVGGHHVLLEAAARSFTALPAGGAGLVPLLQHVAGLGAFVFETGLRLAAPFTAALLLSNLTVGALGRLIPQLNLMSVQLPAQIAISLALLAASATPLVDVLAGLLGDGQAELLAGLLEGAP